ncbi:kinesin light chain [Clathrospora elynae]|uniref:Kinesin light chain n=1 Tax=Clathrospora elynae TaxID=706981 RepID=A0A6A5STE3_9PLEO|nr:kinesin light chain [Clathrospora elynae]
MASSTKPTSCANYHVAWICPVADIEFLPARLMLDEEHPTPPYDTHYDENTYTCGTINGHAVVVATCPPGETGNVNAGRLTGSMFKTFPNIRMAVLVGIGGGIPSPEVSENALENVHLGDVVVGWPGDGKPACVYHDRGRSKGDGQFEMVGTMGNPDWRLTNALGVLVVDDELGQTTFIDQLARLQRSKAKTKFARPGLEHDKLFKAAYRHAGDYRSKCTTCDLSELVQRPQRSEEEQQTLVFHRGRIATGNAVIQDGKLRDEIRTRCDGALCVEMEAAGVDANKRCLVIRGISDYADSHKSDMWRSYAAGNAAAFTRELLCRIQPGEVKKMEPEALWLIPLPRPQSFVGRKTQLAQASAHISLQGCRRLAIYGLGGCGKTALALEAAYQAGEQQPAHAIFWVPAVSKESFEQAYREIGQLLRIPGIADAKTDVKQLVKAKLSDEGFGRWLMVVDNADDVDVLFSALNKGSSVDRLIDYLPYSRKGSIVFTTRTAKAASNLAQSNVIGLGELGQAEAKELLRIRLFPKHQHQVEDEVTVGEFLGVLAFLALAIVQAVAFINENDIKLSDYVRLYRASEQEATKLLSEEFQDQGRYRETKNPVATTWYISFEQIRACDQLAADYLSFMACTASTDIPESMLPADESRVAETKAIGTLKAYAFVTERRPAGDGRQQQQERTKAFDVHQLVHLATRSWLKAQNQWLDWAAKTTMRLVELVPLGDHSTIETWTACMPHARHVASVPEMYEAEARMRLLDRIGQCEQTLGQYKAAEETHRQLLERRDRVLGKKHPSTLTSMSNLALVLGHQGKYEDAEAMNRQTLGREHPETLTSMSNLAVVLEIQGKYEDAEAMNRQTLARREKVLGPEHPDTLMSMSNHAYLLATANMRAKETSMHQCLFQQY